MINLGLYLRSVRLAAMFVEQKREGLVHAPGHNAAERSTIQVDTDFATGIIMTELQCRFSFRSIMAFCTIPDSM